MSERTFVTIGDSQTEGYPVGVQTSWRAFVHSRKPNWKWIGTKTDLYGLKHDGRSGQTVPAYLAVLTTVLNELVLYDPPTDIVVMLGPNDALAAYTKAKFVADMTTLTNQVKAAFPNARYWLVTACPQTGQPYQFRIDIYNQAMRDGEIAGYHAVIDPAALTYTNADFAADVIHLNATGCLKVMQTFLDAFNA